MTQDEINAKARAKQIKDTNAAILADRRAAEEVRNKAKQEAQKISLQQNELMTMTGPGPNMADQLVYKHAKPTPALGEITKDEIFGTPAQKRQKPVSGIREQVDKLAFNPMLMSYPNEVTSNELKNIPWEQMPVNRRPQLINDASGLIEVPEGYFGNGISPRQVSSPKDNVELLARSPVPVIEPRKQKNVSPEGEWGAGAAQVASQGVSSEVKPEGEWGGENASSPQSISLANALAKLLGGATKAGVKIAPAIAKQIYSVDKKLFHELKPATRIKRAKQVAKKYKELAQPNISGVKEQWAK